jgi:hypothetical protein
MNEEQRIADYNAGFEQGKLHSTPSPETIRRIDHIEEKLNELITLIKELTTFIKTI